MQSSTAIAFRALVMLICLVSVPLFAIFGKNLPEVLKGLVEGRGLVLAPAEGAKTTQASGDTKLPGASSPSPSSSTPSGEFRAIGEGSFATGPLSPPPLVGDSAVSSTSPNVDAVMQPASFSPAVDSRPLTSVANAEPPAATPPPQAEAAAPLADVAAPQSFAPSATPSASGEHFRQAETRLRELGATHYMLETWGPQNNRYRFVCKMALGEAAGINRYFQAIDDDPFRAMEVVLAEVEQWRTHARQ